MNREARTVEWIDAYLDWMVEDEGMLARAGDAERTLAELSAEEREDQREAALLDALHMEAECMRVVAQILDRGGRSPEALAMALETLRFADRMLADEQRAWNALQAQRRWELALSPKRAWETQLQYRWDTALDHVAADVQALTGRVLALQTFQA